MQTKFCVEVLDVKQCLFSCVTKFRSAATFRNIEEAVGNTNIYGIAYTVLVASIAQYQITGSTTNKRRMLVDPNAFT